jgi:hypothetical protein
LFFVTSQVFFQRTAAFWTRGHRRAASSLT